MPKTESLIPATQTYHFPTSAQVGGDQGRDNRGQTSSLWEQLSLSKFPYRWKLLYGLLLEIRSFYHRILLLQKRGCIRQLEMGLVYEKANDGSLTLNKQTRARTQDMQRLLASLPWLSPEDGYLMLLGWNAGSESREQRGIAEKTTHTSP
ncbi:MAG TPA: hypothetical protein VK722_07210 [Candidatus Aquilonibacter sp.]|nr:hypothetical protein [Candidatus Aquilonibacter sp.]